METRAKEVCLEDNKSGTPEGAPKLDILYSGTIPEAIHFQGIYSFCMKNHMSYAPLLCLSDEGEKYNYSVYAAATKDWNSNPVSGMILNAVLYSATDNGFLRKMEADYMGNVHYTMGDYGRELVYVDVMVNFNDDVQVMYQFNGRMGTALTAPGQQPMRPPPVGFSLSTGGTIVGSVVTLPYQELVKLSSWNGINLSGILASNFLKGISGISLSNVHFDSAKLKDVDFSGATFSGPVFFKGTVFTGGKFGEKRNFGQMTFEDANISSLDFTSYTLGGADFTSSTARSTKFDSTSNNQATKYTKADLSNASFKSATLQYTNFDSSTLNQTDFTDATLTGVSMQGVNLSSTVFNSSFKFQSSSAHPTNLTNATIPLSLIKKDWSYLILDGAKIPGVEKGADLTDLNATGTNLSNQSFNGVNFANCLLHGTILTQTSFVGCNLSNATITSSTAFNGTNFTESVLTKANLTGAQLGETDDQDAAVFSRAYLTNVNFTSANLYKANMSFCQMYGADSNLTNCNMNGVDLSNSNVGSASFAGVSLSGAVLDCAILIGCNFTNAKFGGGTERPASLVQAYLAAADFTGSNLNGAILTNAAVAMADGVPLFRVDVSSNISALNSATLSSHLKDEFRAKGHVLSDKATVTVTIQGSQWKVVDSSDDLPIGSYSTYNLLKMADGVNIQVYGKVVIIQRLKRTDQGDQKEIVHVSFNETKISPDNFDEYTICPNGIRYGQQSDDTTFEEMMTAKTVVSPPQCIPTPWKWCPHPTAVKFFGSF